MPLIEPAGPYQPPPPLARALLSGGTLALFVCAVLASLTWSYMPLIIGLALFGVAFVVAGAITEAANR